MQTSRSAYHRNQRAAGSHAGGSRSWNAAHVVKPKPKNRYAWPRYGGGFAHLIWDPTKRGPINVAMLAPTGTGGGTSKPNPQPKPVEKPGGGSSPKRA